MRKNGAFPKISNKKFSISAVEKFHQWRNLRKKFCFRFQLLDRAAVKLGRSFLWKQIRASRTANLTEYIYLSRALKNRADQRPGLPLYILRYATGNIQRVVFYSTFPSFLARNSLLGSIWGLLKSELRNLSTPANHYEHFRSHPEIVSEDFRTHPKISKDFPKILKNHKNIWKLLLNRFRSFPKVSEDFRQCSEDFKKS